MNELPRRVLYYGADEPLPERRTLRAGPLTVCFEEGGLRWIRLGECEILRGVYVAIRDRSWGTVPPRLSDLRIEQGAARFRISFDCRHRRSEIDFSWRGTIEGDERGTIAFSMDGVARSTFWRGRIGFCVLHPPESCAGAPYRALKSDGSVEQGKIPTAIAPHQPVKDLRGLAHEVLTGLWADLRFEGETFEMEDQRNWTDASYKTYCTPLHLPSPVEVREGTRIAQSVTLTLQGDLPAVPAGPAEPVVEIGSAPVGPLPRIGLGSASHGRPLGARELERLRALHLAHLRVDLQLAEAGWPAALRRAADEAGALGLPLEVALVLSDAAEDELRALGGELERVRPAVATWLVFHVGEPSTTERWVTLARPFLERYAPDANVGAGAKAYFTQLNRGRPPVRVLDLVCYSINPQVHAFDNASLVETLPAQAWTVESARRFSGDLPLAISPITLKPRFNASATGPEPPPAPGELPWPVDVRQMSLFGAAWTVGSLKSMAESAVESVTYYETSGWRGVMETPDGSPEPAHFRSLPGAVFPLYHVLADVGEFTGGEVLPTVSSRLRQVTAVAVRRDGRLRALVANLGPEPCLVTVRGLGPTTDVKRLDETNALDAMRSPESFRSAPAEPHETAGGELALTLLPYAVARIDS